MNDDRAASGRGSEKGSPCYSYILLANAHTEPHLDASARINNLQDAAATNIHVLFVEDAQYSCIAVPSDLLLSPKRPRRCEQREEAIVTHS